MEKEASIGAVYKFMGKNFKLWKNQLRNALDGREIFTIVDGTETLENTEDKEAWRRKIILPNGLSPRQSTRNTSA